MTLCVIGDCSAERFARQLCRKHYARAWRSGLEPRAPHRCAVAGCVRKHKGHGYCSLHLARERKGHPLTGPLRTLRVERYRVLTCPQHPLAMRNGRVYEHRQVLYDAVAGSPLPCFWCGTALTWERLCVDHVDHDRHNNNVRNLVPACNSCNAGRMRPGQRTSVYQVVGS